MGMALVCGRPCPMAVAYGHNVCGHPLWSEGGRGCARPVQWCSGSQFSARQVTSLTQRSGREEVERGQLFPIGSLPPPAGLPATGTLTATPTP